VVAYPSNSDLVSGARVRIPAILNGVVGGGAALRAMCFELK